MNNTIEIGVTMKEDAKKFFEDTMALVERMERAIERLKELNRARVPAQRKCWIVFNTYCESKTPLAAFLREDLARARAFVGNEECHETGSCCVVEEVEFYV